MNLNNEKDRKSFFSIVLLGLAMLLMGCTAFELIKIARGEYSNQALTEEALEQIKPDPEKTRQYLAQYQQAADDLTQQNSFVPPPDGPEEPGDCTAIFGDEARIGDRWVKAGDRIGDAQVESIGPTAVTLLFEGRQITRKPVLVAEDDSRNARNQRNRNTRADRSGRGGRGGGRGRQGGNPDQARQAEITNRVQAFMESDAAVRMRSYWEEGEGRNMINNFINASPQQRQAQIEQFRQQFQGGVFEFRTSTSGGDQQQTVIIRQDQIRDR